MLKNHESTKVRKMGLCFAAVVLASVALAQGSSVAQNSGQIANLSPAPTALPPTVDLSALPPLPEGKSTVEGGTIRSVDPVRDQMILTVYGAKPMKILFDERTQVYRDGSKASLSDLHANDHASVQTVLDGTKIFAVSIHMLSQAPEGEAQGQVTGYDAGTGQLNLTAALSGTPITLHVPTGISVVGVGQVTVASSTAGLQELVKGTLVSVKFDSSNNGRGVARQISILATPGSSFVFIGSVISLDLSANRLVLLDPKDDQHYLIVFDRSRLPMSRELHVGTRLKVTASFDGSHYVATAANVL